MNVNRWMVTALGLSAAGLAAAVSCAPAWALQAPPAGSGHWETVAATTDVVVPVYGWKYVGSRTNSVFLSQWAGAAAPLSGSGMAGRSFAYTSGRLAGRAFSAARNVSVARDLAHSHQAARSRAGGGSARPNLTGTFYGRLGDAMYQVILSADAVTMTPLDDGRVDASEARSFPVTEVQIENDGAHVQMHLEPGAPYRGDVALFQQLPVSESR